MPRPGAQGMRCTVSWPCVATRTRIIRAVASMAVALGTLLLAPAIIRGQDVVTRQPSLVIDVGPTLHVSTMEWRLGSPTAPRSQLEYERVRSLGISTSAEYRLMNRGRWSALVTVRGAAARVLAGRAQDSDYAWGDSSEYSRSVSQVTGDRLLAAAGALAIGRTLNLGRTPWQLHVAAGYAQQQGTFRKQHGVQVIPEDVPSDLLQDLDSRYRARWSGPWIGAGASMVLGRGSVELDAARHFRTAYSGEGEWNLRTDLMQPVSFVHSAKGSGYDVGVGYVVAVAPRIALVLTARTSSRNALHGFDIEYPVTGEPTRAHLGAVTAGNWVWRLALRSTR
jgi:hypothetical protein